MPTTVDLNKVHFKTNDELKGYLVELVYEYACKINALERDIFEKANANEENDYFPEFKERYEPIFTAFCTEKRRARGRFANAYGSPTRFDGIENALEKKVRSKAKSKAEIYFRTQNSFNAEYLFVVLEENGVWRIDGVRERWYNSRNWRKAIL